jgi:murein DD-endopeptidase MepM/ murein hydrolase activator NlpD
MTSYIHKVGDQMWLTLDGVRYVANPTSSELWVLNAVEAGPGPGEPPTSGDQTFDWPFDPNTTVTSEYGPRNGRIHQGIDFGKGGVTAGVDIHAAAQGTIINCVTGKHNDTSVSGGWGNFVVIDHGIVNARQLYTLYAHMLYPGPIVALHDEVEKGQVLGYVNNTGNSYGDHLHWETHIANPGGIWTSTNPGTHINPRTFMATYQDVPVPEISLEGY